MNSYKITRGVASFRVYANNPGDAIELAALLHNLPRSGITAQRDGR
jgi:hypothetical protein